MYQGHVKYIHNEIVKTFGVGILQYAEHVHEMHDLAKYFYSPSTKGKGVQVI